MFAIHNKNYDLAKLLFTTNDLYKNKSWKSCYKNIIVPEDIQECLFSTHNQDFSFLFYIIAIWTDNADALQKLYSQKIPTRLGQQILISESNTFNPFNCFDIIIDNPIGKIVIKNSLENITTCLQYSAEIIESLVKNNMMRTYDIQQLLSEYSKRDHKTNKHIVILLQKIYDENQGKIT